MHLQVDRVFNLERQCMKLLHKNNLFCWTHFDEDRNIDFHSYLWVRDEGNVVFDPLPLTAHDENHLNSLGKVSYIFGSCSNKIKKKIVGNVAYFSSKLLICLGRFEA